MLSFLKFFGGYIKLGLLGTDLEFVSDGSQSLHSVREMRLAVYGVSISTGLPHSIDGDDVYRGYRITSGATIVANQRYECTISKSKGSF